MRDYNTLEAIDLCINGNPVADPKIDIGPLLEKTIRKIIRRLLRPEPRPAFKKESHVSRPIGEGPEPIIMPNGKKHFVTDDPVKFKKEMKAKQEALIVEMMKADEESGLYDIYEPFYEGLRLRVKKEFSKFCKWLKYSFSLREPFNKIVDSYRNSSEFNKAINKLSQSIKSPGHRSPPKPPTSPGEITKNKECEELASTTPFTKDEFLSGYNLFMPHVEHSKIKSMLSSVSYRCMRQGGNFSDAVNENLSAINGSVGFSREKKIDNSESFCITQSQILEEDRIKRAQKLTKATRKKRYKASRKKRYSISTPIVRV